MKKFYKYIQKRGDSYSIIKRGKDGVEWYGTYSKLTDALYERDRLIEADWDWDTLMEMEETENKYESMELPKFIHEMMYIAHTPEVYKVYIGHKYKGSFRNKSDANEYAEMIGGRVTTVKGKYRVQKSINGKTVYFNQYPTLEEAQKRRDELIENGWIK